jgi:hypothetical protein
MAYIRNVKVDASIVSTRDYEGGTFFSKKLKGGTTFIVTRVHKGFFGATTHLDVRNPKTGERFKKVPWDVFEA